MGSLFNNEQYKVVRHPSYERKKSRGEGVILEQAKAEIYLPSGKIIEKTKEVDEYIENLLGINVSQFSQIALLAQGEFLKILNSDTQTRGEIFRNIFKTWNYANFQNKLKDESLLLKNKFEHIKASTLQYISDIVALDDELKNLKEKYIKNNCFDSLDELIELLQKQNKNDDKILKSSKKEIENIENTIKTLYSTYQTIQQKRGLIIQIEEINSSIKNQKEDFALIEKEYINLENLKKDEQKINLEIKKLDEDYKKSLEIKDLKKAICNLEKELKFNNKETIKWNEFLNDLKLNYLKFNYNLYLELEEELKNKQKEFLNFKEENENLSKEYLKKYNEYLSKQAGILAQELIKNKPCPVCGSIEHPNPAQLEESDLSKELIDKLKNELDIKNNELSILAQNCSILVERVEYQKNNFKKLSSQFKIEIEEKYHNIEEMDFEREIEETIKEINLIKEKINAISSQISEAQAKIELLSRNMSSNIEEILLNHDNLLKEKNNIEEKIKNIENSYISKKVDLNNNISKLEILNKQIKELDYIDISDLDNISSQIKQNEDEIKKIDSSLQEIFLRKGINSNALDLIKEKNKEYNEISKQYTNYKILSDCANGMLKGKARIPFEQYIQGYYLDLVLFEANKRLKTMTNNQFQLLRKKDSFALNSKSGLELEVMDFHTFKKRSTKTLSGGESFKASLALALGLSDCISNFSNTLNIEAMFIDEGFGSLDSESRELALDVVFDLSTNNRLIGLISHIDDLKNKIQNQINVIKTQNGSKIEINF